MKANNGEGNNESRDSWETPHYLFDVLNRQYNFDLDCCATKTNKKVDDFSSNFLKTYPLGLFKSCWMNPPFSKAEEMIKHFFKYVPKGVMIYRCDNMETKIWQEIIFPNATWIFIPTRRIVYEGMDGSGPRFPSALIGLMVKKPIQLKGTILEIDLKKVCYKKDCTVEPQPVNNICLNLGCKKRESKT